MDLHADLGQVLDELGDVQVLVVLEVPLGHREQRFVRPLLVPVDRAAVDDAGELTAPHSQLVPHGREGQHDVQVVPDQVHEVLKSVVSGLKVTGLFSQGLDVPDDLLDILWSHQVGHFPGVQDVVDVLKEGLPHDLGVREEEHSRLVLRAGLLQEDLEVVLPLLLLVVLGDFYREGHELSYEGGQSSQGASPGASHSDQQGVPSGLPQNPAYP